MRAWLDCEFNGYKGELLSIALAYEDGSQIYEVLHPQEAAEPWVAQNVVPILGNSPRRTPREVSVRLSASLCRYDAVHIIVDWPDDIKYFCEKLLTGPGTCVIYPPLTFEIKPELSCESADVRHNALSDAIALKLDQQRRERTAAL